MAGETSKDLRLTQYLLGQMSETERVEIEDRFFADDALFEYLAAIETELIDAYVRGELPEPDRLRRLLGSPRLRARIAVARRLNERAVMFTAPAVSAAGPANTSRKTPAPGSAPREQGQKPIAGVPAKKTTSPVTAAIAAGLVLVAGVAGWWAFQSKSPQVSAGIAAPSAPTEGRPIALSMPAAPPPVLVLVSATPGPVALVLAPGSASTRETSAMLTKPEGADVLRIQIDHHGSGYERYAVVITRERERIWAETAAAPRAPGASGTIVQFPAGTLAAGDYLVTLSGGAMQARKLQYIADYALRVR
jgi:hypothetical protein